MKRALSILFVLVLATALCVAPVASYADESVEANRSPYHTLAELEGKRVGVMTGSVLDQMVEDKIPTAEVVYCNTVADGLLALGAGTIDAYACDEVLKYAFLKENPNIAMVEEPLDYGQVGELFNKGEAGQRLCTQFNEFLSAMNADGRMAAIREKWFAITYDDNPPVDFSDLSGQNGTLNVFFDPTVPPVAFLKDGKAAGFDIDLLHAFCQEYGYVPEFYYTDPLGSVQAVSSGRGDMGIGYISITDERAQQVLFSDPYARNDMYLFTLSEEALANNAAASTTSPLDTLATQFQKSFIAENRWTMYVEGLGTTLLITLLSVVLGTALAVLICAMARSQRAWLRGIVKTLSALAAGIPILVFLMVLYYVVFAKVDIPAILIASLGFSIYFGLEMGEVLKNSLETVPKGQWETCRVMGMSKLQAMRYVVLPQILPVVLPQYKSHIVSLLKGTSVVGYITIQDLTRMSDIVRSRTFDALFPLLCAAVLYFVIVWIIILAFNRIQIRTSPGRRVPKMCGVRLDGLTETKTDARPTANEFIKVEGTVCEPIVELSHVRKEYPNAVPLADVNGTICRGDVVSIIGPSGTGKTTLIRLINGLEPVSGGTITVFGTDITASGIDIAAATKRTTMVFQQFNLFPHLTIAENIMLAPVILNGVPVQDAYDRAMGLLRVVHLHSKAFNYPSELSGGQQQRVAIVRAMATDPDVLMLDEPTSALDPTSTDEIISILGRLRKAGMTMMIVTHDMRLAREASTRIFYMDQGQIYEEGTPQQVFNEPQRRLTQHFVRQMKIWNIEIDDRDFDDLDMLSSVRAFMKDYDMDKPLATAVYAQVETMIGKALELLNDDVTINCFIEYSVREGDANVCLAYDGPQRAIMEEFDQNTLELIEFYADKITYEYTTRNEYVIDCRPQDLRAQLNIL